MKPILRRAFMELAKAQLDRPTKGRARELRSLAIWFKDDAIVSRLVKVLNL